MITVSDIGKKIKYEESYYLITQVNPEMGRAWLSHENTGTKVRVPLDFLDNKSVNEAEVKAKALAEKRRKELLLEKKEEALRQKNLKEEKEMIAQGMKLIEKYKETIK